MLNLYLGKEIVIGTGDWVGILEENDLGDNPYIMCECGVTCLDHEIKECIKCETSICLHCTAEENMDIRICPECSEQNINNEWDL